MLLIAVGAGGVKACVVTFGADQFILPQQERHMERYFNLFHLSLSVGILVSTAVVPYFRQVTCFGDTECYSAAFGLPAALMVISLGTYLRGQIGMETDHGPVTSELLTIFQSSSCWARGATGSSSRRRIPSEASSNASG